MKPRENQPFKDEWRALLRRNLPFYRFLPVDTRARFDERLGRFLAKTKIVSGTGLAVLEEPLRVTLAAAAIRLAVDLPGGAYGRLRTVVVSGVGKTHEGGPIVGQSTGGYVWLTLEAARRGDDL